MEFSLLFWHDEDGINGRDSDFHWPALFCQEGMAWNFQEHRMESGRWLRTD